MLAAGERRIIILHGHDQLSTPFREYAAHQGQEHQTRDASPASHSRTGFSVQTASERLTGMPRSSSKETESHIRPWLLLASASGLCRWRPPRSHAEYWVPKLERNKRRDKKTIQELRKLGWRSLVIWECQMTHERSLAHQYTNSCQRPKETAPENPPGAPPFRLGLARGGLKSVPNFSGDSI